MSFLRSFVGRLLRVLPEDWVPWLRQMARYAGQSVSSAKVGRVPVSAHRVVWLRTEVADLEKILLPGPGRGQVIVEMEYTVISQGTERAFLGGYPNTGQTFPSGAGYSGVGRVVSRGAGVGDLTVGQRVAGVMPHASHALVDRDKIVPVPDGVAPEAAAFAQLGVITLHGLRMARLTPGSSVVVIGLGLIGQLGIQLARWAGAAPVIGVARSERHFERAKVSGADAVVALPDGVEVSQDLEADVVIEASGSADAVPTALRLTAPHGRVALLGSSRHTTHGLPLREHVVDREIEIVGTHISGVAKHESTAAAWTRRDETSLFLKLIGDGIVDPLPLIDNLADPSQANQVYESILEGRAPGMGILFDWTIGSPGEGVS